MQFLHPIALLQPSGQQADNGGEENNHNLKETVSRDRQNVGLSDQSTFRTVHYLGDFQIL
jgi:hypothetical protein